MPFGLKNVGTTYQRLMNKLFAYQIGRNVQVYVDGMLVKSIWEDDHLNDLQETFDTLWSYNMKLNPSECAFGVTARKFLGFMVSQRGIKGNPDKIQAIMELTLPKTVKEVQSLNGKGAKESPQWSIHTDGSSNRQAGGDGVVLHSPEGDKVECMVRLDFPTTNNEVEYEALIAGLDLTKAAGAANMVVYCDSQVVTSQVNGDYECKNERMKKYFEQVKNRVSDLQAKFVQIPREENEHTNHLAKAASAEHMLIPSQDGVLPDDKEAVRKLKGQATGFVLIRDILYNRGFSQPYLRCLIPEEAEYVMQKVHEGVCENHFRSRSLVHKLIWAGYYWPTRQKNAIAYVKTCDKCQSEAVIPAKVGLTSYRVGNHDEGRNDEAMCLQLDLVDEVRETTEQRLSRYQDLMAKHYNSKVRHRDIQVGDLVLRRVTDATKDTSQGKLGPSWEGPYRITPWHKKGTYHLETLDGQKVHHP
ncbi:uncharacterized protein LOC115952727 [Quercus lobata]|uniref:uncharacterized protein LOC115952727 n=1 Tax=Quercus lobata TaxID=97700 RepID=UPI001244FA7F|nr:uncharacterized protein LOC115952727 [Quercus lobata]